MILIKKMKFLFLNKFTDLQGIQTHLVETM